MDSFEDAANAFAEAKNVVDSLPFVVVVYQKRRRFSIMHDRSLELSSEEPHLDPIGQELLA